LAESYIYGTAMSSGKLYKINIQSGHTSILVPNDFEIYVGSALIYFNTETKNRFTIKSNAEKGKGDLIEIYVNNDNLLLKLAKDLPVVMTIKEIVNR
jgi:hypothetical protein